MAPEAAPADYPGMRTALLFLALTLPLALVAKHGNGKGPKHKDAAVQTTAVYFQPGHVQIINNYYAPSGLPRGLQKKLMRTGSLPPGWEKRFRPFPYELAHRLPPVCANCGGGVLDGYAVIYDKKTRIIYDVAALAADILR